MNSSAEGFRRRYEELKEKGFPFSEALNLTYELGDSEEIELHFEFVLEDRKRPRAQRWHPEDTFRHHRYKGVLYLKSLLTSEDQYCAVEAAYLLAELLPRGRYPNQEELTGELIKTLLIYAESDVAEYRRNCLIALGWVGTEHEIPTLERHLRSDPDELCRAWSASAFLQMSGRLPNDILREKTCEALAFCIEHEPDVFVRGVAVETVQEIWNVKFGLRSSAVEARDQKAVDRGASRALKYLNEEAKLNN